jgi:hypothetical protein
MDPIFGPNPLPATPLLLLQAEAQKLNAAWSAERSALEQRKAARSNLQKARADLGVAEREGDLVRAGELKYSIIPRLEKEFSQWSKAAGAGGNFGDDSLLSEQVTPAHIAEVVSRATGIPATRLVAAERERLLDMEATLAKTVIGQDEALAVVANAVRVSRAGLQSPDRPLGTFMLVGPTGVGKTHLCKALADFLFDSQDAVTRLDMTEFSERHAVSRLVGAPPGYVGYDEGGQLTEAVRRRPYTVLLLDEFEKVHASNCTLPTLRPPPHSVVAMLRLSGDGRRAAQRCAQTAPFFTTTLFHPLGPHHSTCLNPPPLVSPAHPTAPSQLYAQCPHVQFSFRVCPLLPHIIPHPASTSETPSTLASIPLTPLIHPSVLT